MPDSKPRPRALDAKTLPARRGTLYPDKFKPRVAGREKRALGNAFGLQNFGVNLVKLEPGAQSSLRHWHTQQDEFVWMLEGELTLVTDAGAEILRPGMCAGFAKGKANGHHLVNRSDKAARVLEIGTRTVEEIGHYSDIDMMVREDASGWGYYTKDGRPLK